MKTRSILPFLFCVAALGAATPALLAGNEPQPFPKSDDASGQCPQLVRSVDPLYPANLAAENIEGDVQVQFIVDKDGHVVEAHAVSSSHPDFAGPAVDAVKQWTFTPGKKDGRVVNTQMQVPIHFALPPKPSK